MFHICFDLVQLEGIYMLKAQPLSVFEELRSSVGVHCPHVNWSTIWAFPGLCNVLLLWKLHVQNVEI
jgi:hypothetical protein